MANTANGRSHRYATTLALIAVSACGSDADPVSPGVTPDDYSLSVVEGNGQRGFPGAQLSDPVVFELKAGSMPVSDEQVQFSVPLGSAFVQPTSAVTDAAGRVSTALSLGGTPGSVRVRAELPGLSIPSAQATLEVLATEAELLNAEAGTIYDLVLDLNRNRVYVTHHEESSVGAHDIETGERLWTVPVDGRPHGAELSSDGTELFVALAGAGAVAALDLESLDVELILVEDVTGHAETWDVVETSPGTLFVSANPASSGLAYLGKVDRANPAGATRVADGRVIRGGPILIESPDGTTLFVAEAAFSPNSLYRLDLTQANAPIVGEDVHGSVSGVWWTRPNRAGTRLYLGSGQVLDPETLVEIGAVPSGSSLTSMDDSIVFVFNSNGFRAYETSSFSWIGDVDLPTSNAQVWMSAVPGTDDALFATAGELWRLQLIRPSGGGQE